MLNEHERENGPEEGEYHFSDEGGYGSSEEEAKAPVVSESNGLAAKFSSYRRFVIIGALAAGVFLVVYLAIPPLTTSTPTEITAVTSPPAPAEVPAAPSAPVKAMAVEQPKAVPAPTPTRGFSQMVAEEREKLAAEKNKVMAHLSPRQEATPATLTPPAANLAPQAAAATTEAGLAPAQSPVVSPMTQEFIASPMATLGQAATVQAATESKAALDRLAAMEETNTKMIGQLHAEYAQKVADYDVQNKALQEQVHTLNSRLASMETEMSKLVQALNKQPSAPLVSEGPSPMAENTSVTVQGSPAAVPVNPSAPPPQGAYKSNYAVQAIIPGRAWLRTESGETITVAEGDMLRSLGRVTKIDPYDGTISIDTGAKVIVLTYGNGEYS